MYSLVLDTGLRSVSILKNNQSLTGTLWQITEEGAKAHGVRVKIRVRNIDGVRRVFATLQWMYGTKPFDCPNTCELGDPKPPEKPDIKYS